MFERMFDKGALPALETALGFTARRHKLLVSNIANVDTPGYRARDLKPEAFNEQLQASLDAQYGRKVHTFRLASGRAVSADGDPERPGGRPTRVYHDERPNDRNLTFRDLNNRSVETEMNELTKNALRHRGIVELLRSQYALIESAIRERPDGA